MNAINRPRRVPPAASTPTPHLPNTPSPITPYALGLHLGRKRQEQHLLDILHGQLGSEEPRTPMDNRRFAQRQACNAEDACAEECYALEDLILASQVRDQPDAAVMTLIVLNRLNRLVDGVCDKDRALEEKRLFRALVGVIKVLAPAAGVQLADIGGRFYAPSWCDPCPTVDLSEVMPDASCLDTCIDGSGGAA